MTGRVGVVMTAYNSASFITEALQSLTDQSWTDWHCVVVDDGSTDDTVRLIQQAVAADDRISLVRAAHSGVSRARNIGLDSLTDSAPYVAFFDSDDVYLPDALAHLVAVLAERPDAVGVYGMAEYMDAEGNPADLGAHPADQRDRRMIHHRSLVDLAPGRDSTFADIAVRGAIWPSAVALHRRAAVDEIGQFDVSFTRQGDWDLYVRLSRLGVYAVLDEQVAWYRRHGANLTGSVVESCYMQDRVRYKAFRAPENTWGQRAVVARGAWRLRLADLRRIAQRVPRDVAARDPRAVAYGLRGVAVLGTSLVTVAPPRPSRRRVRWTRVIQDETRRDG